MAIQDVRMPLAFAAAAGRCQDNFTKRKRVFHKVYETLAPRLSHLQRLTPAKHHMPGTVSIMVPSMDSGDAILKLGPGRLSSFSWFSALFFTPLDVSCSHRHGEFQKRGFQAYALP